ncbi:MAG: hypothetical protein ACHQRL_10380 [Gemmatimonadales bacterium]
MAAPGSSDAASGTISFSSPPVPWSSTSVVPAALPSPVTKRWTRSSSAAGVGMNSFG